MEKNKRISKELKKELRKAFEDVNNGATTLGPGETIVITKDGRKIMSTEEVNKLIVGLGTGVGKVLEDPLEIKLDN